MRLIDADTLKEHKYHSNEDGTPVEFSAWKQGWNDAIDAITNYALTVDAVPVVRCKDCRWFENDGYHTNCKIIRFCVESEDYCSRGIEGHWIKDKGIYKCTACNSLCTVAGWADCIPEKQMYEVFKFCPNCGAKMEETK